MDSKNIILHLPFDESSGATKTYDYSQSRADGVVHGATFVKGKDGNAINFSGEDYCEIEKQILDSLNGDFTILAFVRNNIADTGTPTQISWLLNYGGLDYVEIPTKINPGAWYNVALVKSGTRIIAYVNNFVIYENTHAGSLKGLSLNQDFYFGDYAFGALDDFKFFNVALSAQELIEEVTTSKEQIYTIDGVDFREYGVYVSGSDGLLTRPKMKAPASLSWDNYHGESVDLMNKFYEPREITLSCFIKAENKIDFIRKVNTFQALFDKKGTNRIVLDVHPVKPLIYEVYAKDAIDIQKTWRNDIMVGTFKLKLTEPEPVKRILKHIVFQDAYSSCQIKITTTKYVNIFWGDGSATYDISGNDVTIEHEYTKTGEYFPVVTGCIDEIEKFETNAIVVWEKI